MKVDYSQALDALLFIEDAFQCQFPLGSTWLASRQDSGKLSGVVLFEPVREGDCIMHMAAASPFWFTPTFCREVFQHVFHTLAAQRASAPTYQTNTRSVKLLQRTGWSLEGSSPGFRGGTKLHFGMLKENCKWVDSSAEAPQKPQTPIKLPMRS